MDKITIPEIGTFDSSELVRLLAHLSDLNGEWHHFDLTEDEHMKIKVTIMTIIRDLFSNVEYTESQCRIRCENRSFDSDGLARFYRNMWSHQKK